MMLRAKLKLLQIANIKTVTDPIAQVKIVENKITAAGDIVAGLNQICVATGQAAIAATAVHNSL